MNIEFARPVLPERCHTAAAIDGFRRYVALRNVFLPGTAVSHRCRVSRVTPNESGAERGT